MTDDVLSEAGGSVQAPGHLPDFSAVDMPSIFSWGCVVDGTIITVNAPTIRMLTMKSHNGAKTPSLYHMVKSG